MGEQGKIAVANIEDGYAHAEPCNHAWRLKDGDTVRMYDPCPVCAENKAAEKAAREEVLEWGLRLRVALSRISDRLPRSQKAIRQAFKEQFGS